MYNCTTLPVLFKQKLIKHAKKKTKKNSTLVSLRFSPTEVGELTLYMTSYK